MNLHTQPPGGLPPAITSVSRMLKEARQAQVAPEEYKSWLCTMLPDHFRGPDQFASHHERYWEHVWNLPKNEEPLACLAVWNRGGMKSTSAEATGPVLAARGLRRFGVYVSGTQKKADSHLHTVKEMLAASNLGDYYPELAKPEIKKVDTRTVKGEWSHNELSCAGLYMIAVGLDVSVRGLKRGNQRPDFAVLDDIEDEDDSIYVVGKKIERIKSGILSAGADNFAVFFVQNLITRDSVISQTLDGRAEMLMDRIVCGGGPIPALRNAEYREEGSGANKKYFIVKGDPTWVGFDLQRCEKQLRKVGMRTWKIEFQHEVKTPHLDAIFSSFDERYHLITWSEFARVYARWGARDHNGAPRIPQRGHAAVSFDQGTTPGHPSVALWDWQPAEEMPFNRDLFYYRERCWPQFPMRGEMQPVIPEDVGMEIQDAEKVWAEQVKWRQGSHEAKAVRNSFGFFLGRLPGYKNMHFDPIATALKKLGIVAVQDYLGIDKEEFHPFRIDPRTAAPEGDLYVPEHECDICLSWHEGEHLVGKPSMFFIVADGQGELIIDETTGELDVAPAIDADGFARTRWEFPKYRHRRTAQGMETEETPKIDDDAMDALIAGTARRTRKPEKKTEEDQVEERMPEKLRLAQVAEAEAENPDIGMNRYTAYHAAKKSREDAAPKAWRAGTRKKLRSRPS